MDSNLRTRLYSLIIVLTFVSLGLCISETSEEPEEELKPVSEPLEGNIIFTVNEGYEYGSDISEPFLILTMKTTKIYPDHNYEIVSSMKKEDNIISFGIKGIHIPDYVLPAHGPATNRSFLNLPEGNYMLHFSHNNDIDIYSLNINRSSINVVKERSSFTSPEYTLWQRYPPNSFYCEFGTPKDEEWIAQDFFSNLTSNINLIEFNFSNEGVIPYPRSRYYQNYTVQVKYWLYENEEDFDLAGQLLESYVKNVIPQHTRVGINLRNWKNKNLLGYP